MAVTVEEVQVLVTAEVDKAIKGLNKVNKAGKDTGINFKNIAKQIAGPLSLGLAIKVVGDLGKATLQLASDAEETANKFGVVFRDISGAAETAAQDLAENYGLSTKASQQLLSDTGDLLSGFGFTQEAALDLSSQVNKLAVDLASFTNVEGGAEFASQALTKALLGERESVKQLGIAILETDVQAKVLELTQQGLTFETERQAKAEATLRIALEQSKNAIDDFARSSDSYANQVRIAEAATDDLGVALGERLLPVATQIASRFGDIAAALSEYIGDQNLAIQFVKEFNDEGIKTAFTLEELLTIQEQLNKQTEQSGRGGSQQLRNQLTTVQALIDAYGIEDAFLTNRQSRIDVQAEREREAAAEQERRLQIQLDAASRLDEIAEARKSDIEKELELIQEEINAYWQFRDIAEVQALLNDLIEQRSELRQKLNEENRVAVELTDEQAEADARLLGILQEQEAIRDRESRLATERAEEAIIAQEDYNRALEEYNFLLEQASIKAEDLATIGLNSLVSGFEEVGQAIIDGGLSFKTFGKLALTALADVLRSLGAQLSAQGALLLFGLFPDPARAAGAFAASAAAFAGAGIASGAAGALAEGGQFTTNGPQTLLVGDNPGGQERVTVEPVSSNGANVRDRMNGSGDLYLVIEGQPFKVIGQNYIDNGVWRGARGGRIGG